MKTRLLLSAAAFGAMTLASQAQAQDWSGFYVGGSAGYQKLQDESDERILFDTNLDGTFGDTVRVGTPSSGTGADAFSPGFCDGTPNGNNAGAGCSDDSDDSGEIGGRIGFDIQRGSLVFGVVGEVSSGSAEDNVTGFSTTPANYSFRRELDYIAAARLRLGLAAGRFLPYVTGGYAQGNVSSVYGSSNTANSFTPSRRDDQADGWQAGGGVETMITDRLSLGLEYIYTDLEDDGHVVRTGPGTAPATNPFLLTNALGTDQRRSNDSIEQHSIRLTAAIRF